MTVDNPFGMDPDDPAGKDDMLVADPKLHLLVNNPCKVLLRSKDVLHDFAVPQFRVKMDLVPGIVTYLWFTPTQTGKYEMLCEELCGVAHFAMRGRMVVDEPGRRIDKWLASPADLRQADARPAATPTAGAANFATMHGVPWRSTARATSSSTRRSSRASGDWYLARQLQNFKHGVRGAQTGRYLSARRWCRFADWSTTPATRENVVAHIETLPDSRAAATIRGDVEHGRGCSRPVQPCHGDKGEGAGGTNAPRLAGMSDWYLARQLENFKAARSAAATRATSTATR